MILLDRLIELFPTASRQTLKGMVQIGRVKVNGARARRLKQPIGRADVVLVESPRLANEDPDFAIIFEDADILVIDKPQGLLTSTVPRERRPTALAAVRKYLVADHAARVGLIHRLDREASGLLVFSKTRAAYESLKRQFFERSAGRVYAAIVSPPPRPPRGQIDGAGRACRWNRAPRTPGGQGPAGRHGIRNPPGRRRSGASARHPAHGTQAPDPRTTWPGMDRRLSVILYMEESNIRTA